MNPNQNYTRGGGTPLANALKRINAARMRPKPLASPTARKGEAYFRQHP